MKIEITACDPLYFQLDPVELSIINEFLKNLEDEKELIELMNQFILRKDVNRKFDLYYWIPILNKLDEMLETFLEITKVIDEEIVLVILKFTALLLSISYSKSFYNSIEHLEKLLKLDNLQIIYYIVKILYEIVKKSYINGKETKVHKSQEISAHLLYLALFLNFNVKEKIKYSELVLMEFLPESALHFIIPRFIVVQKDNHSFKEDLDINLNEFISNKKDLEQIAEEICSKFSLNVEIYLIPLIIKLRFARIKDFGKYVPLLIEISMRSWSCFILGTYCRKLANIFIDSDPKGFLVPSLVELIKIKVPLYIQIFALQTLSVLIMTNKNDEILIDLIPCISQFFGIGTPNGLLCMILKDIQCFEVTQEGENNIKKTYKVTTIPEEAARDPTFCFEILNFVSYFEKFITKGQTRKFSNIINQLSLFLKSPFQGIYLYDLNIVARSLNIILSFLKFSNEKFYDFDPIINRLNVELDLLTLNKEPKYFIEGSSDNLSIVTIEQKQNLIKALCKLISQIIISSNAVIPLLQLGNQDIERNNENLLLANNNHENNRQSQLAHNESHPTLENQDSSLYSGMCSHKILESGLIEKIDDILKSISSFPEFQFADIYYALYNVISSVFKDIPNSMKFLIEKPLVNNLIQSLEQSMPPHNRMVISVLKFINSLLICKEGIKLIENSSIISKLFKVIALEDCFHFPCFTIEQFYEEIARSLYSIQMVSEKLKSIICKEYEKIFNSAEELINESYRKIKIFLSLNNEEVLKMKNHVFGLLNFLVNLTSYIMHRDDFIEVHSSFFEYIEENIHLTEKIVCLIDKALPLSVLFKLGKKHFTVVFDLIKRYEILGRIQHFHDKTKLFVQLVNVLIAHINKISEIYPDLSLLYIFNYGNKNLAQQLNFCNIFSDSQVASIILVSIEIKCGMFKIFSFLENDKIGMIFRGFLQINSLLSMDVHFIYRDLDVSTTEIIQNVGIQKDELLSFVHYYEHNEPENQIMVSYNAVRKALNFLIKIVNKMKKREGNSPNNILFKTYESIAEGLQFKFRTFFRVTTVSQNAESLMFYLAIVLSEVRTILFSDFACSLFFLQLVKADIFKNLHQCFNWVISMIDSKKPEQHSKEFKTYSNVCIIILTKLILSFCTKRSIDKLTNENLTEISKLKESFPSVSNFIGNFHNLNFNFLIDKAEYKSFENVVFFFISNSESSLTSLFESLLFLHQFKQNRNDSIYSLNEIKNIMALGFTEERAREALNYVNGNEGQAINYLIENPFAIKENSNQYFSEIIDEDIFYSKVSTWYSIILDYVIKYFFNISQSTNKEWIFEIFKLNGMEDICKKLIIYCMNELNTINMTFDREFICNIVTSEDINFEITDLHIPKEIIELAKNYNIEDEVSLTEISKIDTFIDFFLHVFQSKNLDTLISVFGKHNFLNSLCHLISILCTSPKLFPLQILISKILLLLNFFYIKNPIIEQPQTDAIIYSLVKLFEYDHINKDIHSSINADSFSLILILLNIALKNVECINEKLIENIVNFTSEKPAISYNSDLMVQLLVTSYENEVVLYSMMKSILTCSLISKGKQLLKKEPKGISIRKQFIQESDRPSLIKEIQITTAISQKILSERFSFLIKRNKKMFEKVFLAIFCIQDGKIVLSEKVIEEYLVNEINEKYPNENEVIEFSPKNSSSKNKVSSKTGNFLKLAKKTFAKLEKKQTFIIDLLLKTILKLEKNHKSDEPKLVLKLEDISTALSIIFRQYPDSISILLQKTQAYPTTKIFNFILGFAFNHYNINSKSYSDLTFVQSIGKLARSVFYESIFCYEIHQKSMIQLTRHRIMPELLQILRDIAVDKALNFSSEITKHYIFQVISVLEAILFPTLGKIIEPIFNINQLVLLMIYNSKLSLFNNLLEILKIVPLETEISGQYILKIIKILERITRFENGKGSMENDESVMDSCINLSINPLIRDFVDNHEEEEPSENIEEEKSESEIHNYDEVGSDSDSQYISNEEADEYDRFFSGSIDEDEDDDNQFSDEDSNPINEEEKKSQMMNDSRILPLPHENLLNENHNNSNSSESIEIGMEDNLLSSSESNEESDIGESVPNELINNNRGISSHEIHEIPMLQNPISNIIREIRESRPSSRYMLIEEHNNPLLNLNLAEIRRRRNPIRFNFEIQFQNDKDKQYLEGELSNLYFSPNIDQKSLIKIVSETLAKYITGSHDHFQPNSIFGFRRSRDNDLFNPMFPSENKIRNAISSATSNMEFLNFINSLCNNVPKVEKIGNIPKEENKKMDQENEKIHSNEIRLPYSNLNLNSNHEPNEVSKINEANEVNEINKVNEVNEIKKNEEIIVHESKEEVKNVINAEEEEEKKRNREEFLLALPEDVRQEVIQQEQAQLLPSQIRPMETDNATFLATLSPELRREVLLSAGRDFLSSLPSIYVSEARQLRQQNIYLNQENSLLPNFHNKQAKEENVEFEIFISNSLKQRCDLAKINEQLMNSINSIDDKSIEALINVLYMDSKERIPINSLFKNLFKKLIHYEKILDTFIFILTSHHLIQNSNNKIGFPPTKLLNSTDSTKLAYDVISVRILGILQSLVPFIVKYILKGKYPGGHKTTTIKSIRKIRKELNIQQAIKPPIFYICQLIIQNRINNNQLNGIIDFLIQIFKECKSLSEKKKSKMKRESSYNQYASIDGESLENIISICFQENQSKKLFEKVNNLLSYICKNEGNTFIFAKIAKYHLKDLCPMIQKKWGSFQKKVLEGEVLLVDYSIESTLVESKLCRLLSVLWRIYLDNCEEEINDSKNEKPNANPLFIEMEETEIKEISKRKSSIPMQSALIKKEIDQIIDSEDIVDSLEYFVNFLSSISHIKNYEIIRQNLYTLLDSLETFFYIYLPIFTNSYQAKEFINLLKLNIAPPNSKLEKKASMMNKLIFENKKVINEMIRLVSFQSLSKILHPIVAKIPNILDFENKRTYFRQEIKKIFSSSRYGVIHLAAKRDNIFMDSYHQLMNLSPKDFFKRIKVEFVGEEGYDAGGLTREWYQKMSKEMFNPAIALFSPSSSNNTYQPNPRSIVDPNHLKYFKFIGIIIGKAILDNQNLECFFTRSLYKLIVGQLLTYSDLEDVDPQIYKSLKWLMENDISGQDTSLTLSYEKEFFGTSEIIDLVHEGRNIVVTQENKKDFIYLLTRAKLYDEIKHQVDSLLEGIYQLVPKRLLSLFDFREIELIISGLPDFDIEDLKKHTEYKGFSADSQIIKWLWEIIKGYGKTERAEFLQFVTGTSKVPVGGFGFLAGKDGSQKFQIHKTFGGSDHLPTAHTCFLQLDLPEYPSKEILNEKLNKAIKEGREGFLIV